MGFPALAAVPFDWGVTRVFWVDERAVPPSSPDSNFGLADSLWLGSSGASPSNIHRMPADVPDLSAAATACSNELIVRPDEVSGEGCDNSSQGDATAASVLSRYDKASVTGYGYNVFTQSRTWCRASLFGGTFSDWDKVDRHAQQSRLGESVGFTRENPIQWVNW
jgi:Glucosamine-6-phosphate isomerases/6-phosphogluconolactonase